MKDEWGWSVILWLFDLQHLKKLDLTGHVYRVESFPDEDKPPNNVADAPLPLLTVNDADVLKPGSR